MSALGLRQRFELRSARTLSLLSPRAQVRLSGRSPVRIDGQTLEPELQLLLSLIERQGRPPYQELSLPRARAEMLRGAVVAGGPEPALAAVQELSISGAQGALRARHYRPSHSDDPQPLIVFFHGGGFVLGDLDSHDVPCRLLALHAGAQVLSVDYRLAPEHPFPAAAEDAVAALHWALQNAGEFGANPGAIAVAGDSAGGNLAAVAAWRVARERPGEAGPALQILIYPATELIARSRSHELFGEGFLLTRQDMDWFSSQYADPAHRGDPSASILRATDLSGVAPAIVLTAGFDPLRDEGEAYAARLREAGVPVLLRRFPGLIHGFINMAGVSRSSRDAIAELGGMARAMLASAAGGGIYSPPHAPVAELVDAQG